MLFSFHQSKTHFKQVRYLFSLKHHSSSKPFAQEPHNSNKSHTNTSLFHNFGTEKSVLRNCFDLLDKKTEPSTSNSSSLQELLLGVSHLNPRITRKFWRISRLSPKDVLELLLGFEFNTEKLEIEVKKVESLWGIFKWASANGEQGRLFKHLDQSFKVMAEMLVRVGLFNDAESLLLDMDREGILMDSHGIFSDLIEWHVGANELEKSIYMFDRMRGLNLVPSSSCYRALVAYLIHMSENQLVIRVYGDMLEMGFGMGVAEKVIYENVVQLLCRFGEVQEARNIIKKASFYGIKPTPLVLDAIANAYCEKKDYDDLLSLFVEMDSIPDVIVGNKMVHSMCRNFGSEEAFVIMEELEHLGYSPNDITFGILIGWSCQERKLRNAFVYLSNALSRGLKPHIYSYNALISGVFKEGMWSHANDILCEMNDKGVTPNMSTFRVLLAGYCKARQFDEVKAAISKMGDKGLIELSPLEDPLLKAFMLLGVDPLAVRVRRDNDVGCSKTEFFDSMGNGLYLEGDVVEYDKIMTRVLDDSMIPDYNHLILKDTGLNSYKTAYKTINELVQWGQELSFAAFSALVKRSRASNSSFKGITSLLEKMPKLHNELDEETLNFLVQAHVKKGFVRRARTLYYVMVKKNLEIENKTYAALVTGLCKKGNSRDLHECWEIVQKGNWLPDLKDYRTLICSLCEKNMLMESLVLFDHVLKDYPNEALEISLPFLEKLCGIGFSKIACVLVEELVARGYEFDHVAYSHLIRGLCVEKRFSEAFVICDKMLDKSMAPDLDVSIKLISSLCSQGYFDKAISLKEICSKDSSISLNGRCALSFSTGMVEEVTGLVQETISKSKPLNFDFYNVLIHGYCAAKDMRKVKELLVKVLKEKISISISSYRKLVSLMCRKSRFDFALFIKDLMVKEMSSSHIIAYNILIFYLFSSKNSLIIDILLDEIQEKELELDSVTYEFLVYGFSQCKNVSRALQYLTTMISKELKPSNRCFRAVIGALYSIGDLSEVLKLSREMETRNWVHCSTIQNEVVEGLLKIDKVEEAVEFLDKMVQKDLVPDNVNYDNLIKRLCYHGKQDKGIDLLDVMLKKGNIPNSTSYDCIIQGSCGSINMEEALDFYTEMLKRNLKPSIETQEMLIEKLCEVGKTAEAETILECMVVEGEVPRKAMFGAVVSRYRFEKNFSKASEVLKMMQKCGYKPDFDTHWSLISTLSRSSDEDASEKSRNFLSRLLSDSGFSPKRGN